MFCVNSYRQTQFVCKSVFQSPWNVKILCSDDQIWIAPNVTKWIKIKSKLNAERSKKEERRIIVLNDRFCCAAKTKPVVTFSSVDLLLRIYNLIDLQWRSIRTMSKYCRFWEKRKVYMKRGVEYSTELHFLLNKSPQSNLSIC